jgi:hypothetical protein
MPAAATPLVRLRANDEDYRRSLANSFPKAARTCRCRLYARSRVALLWQLSRLHAERERLADKNVTHSFIYRGPRDVSASDAGYLI